jgi:hypothetical protein
MLTFWITGTIHGQYKYKFGGQFQNLTDNF